MDDVAVAYHEAPLPGHPHLAAAWTLAAPEGATGWAVVPDGAIDLVAVAGGELRVAGPATHAVQVDLPAGTLVRGLRLRPGATRALLGVPAHALADLHLAPEDVRPGGLALDAAPAGDALVEEVLRRLARSDVRVADLAADLGVSERQLLRRCRAAVGHGPATLRRVARLQRALGLAPAEPDLAGLAAAAGYADQAHMTGDWTDLCGAPPAALLRDRQVVLA